MGKKSRIKWNRKRQNELVNNKEAQEQRQKLSLVVLAKFKDWKRKVALQFKSPATPKEVAEAISDLEAIIVNTVGNAPALLEWRNATVSVLRDAAQRALRGQVNSVPVSGIEDPLRASGPVELGRDRLNTPPS